MSMSSEQLRDLPQNTKLVVLKDDLHRFSTGDVVYRYKTLGDCHESSMCSTEEDGGGTRGFLYGEEVALYPAQDETPTPLGVFRPNLEERKTGKVLVHLVDQGFPTALYEVAKVMTWAAEHKGYKPHDWKKLPDAENALEGAASRHRMMHNMQRQNGQLASEHCVDDESKLLHKAHEAFNVLAELELMLTGKIA